MRAAGKREFLEGVVAGLPIALAYFPVAVSFGVAAARGGFTLAEATFMSLVIYAGASQFLALALLAGATSPLLAILPLLAMNARHLLYAPALLGAASSGEASGVKQPQRAWLWAFGLTDEVFATALGSAATGRNGWSEAWQLGISVTAYAAWVSGSLTGGALGGGAFERYPSLDAALGFLLPALFLALLLAMLKRRHVPAVLVAGASYVAGAALFGSSNGILIGILAGALAGALTAREGRPS